MLSYAVINVSGRQHRVSVGEKLWLDLQKDAKVGEVLNISDVMMLGGDAYHIGQPFLKGAQVKCLVTGMGEDGRGVKAEKVYAFKKKRRKGFKKLIGHRQRYTEVSVESINIA